MKLLTVVFFSLLFAWTIALPEEERDPSLSRTKRFWNLAPEPNYEPAEQVPIQRPIGWLLPPDYPPPTRRRPTTTAQPTHGLAYQIVKAVVHAGAANVVKALAPTTQRPVVRRTTVRTSQLKRRIRPSSTTTTEVPATEANVLPNPVGDENNVLVPVTTYGQDGKPTVVYMFVPKDRILGYQKEREIEE